MASESWGEIVLPADPDDLVGMRATIVRGSDGRVTLGIDPGIPPSVIPDTAPKVMTRMKVTINGIQLGLPEGMSSRQDEIGESVTEITLSEAALNRLYEQHGKAQITQTQLDLIMGALQPTFEIGEEIKKTLQDRGWTYEEAERVAGDVVRDAIANATKGLIQ